MAAAAVADNPIAGRKRSDAHAEWVHCSRSAFPTGAR
jgi:hypothetical protein